MTTLRQDLRYAFRMLVKNPGFTTVAVLTLALGIGANTAIFSLINAVMLRALPGRDLDSLVLLKWSAKHFKTHSSSSYGDCNSRIGTATGSSSCSFSHPFLDDLRARNEVFSGVAAFANAGRLVLTGSGPAGTLAAQFVSGDYFQTLGILPARGRTFVMGDDQISAPPSVVLSYGYWQRVFGGDSSVVGRQITLNNSPFIVAGVAQKGFTGLTPGNVFDAWLPLSFRQRINPRWRPEQDDSGSIWLVIVGRLKPGMPRAQAEAAVSLFFRNEVMNGDKPLAKAEDEPSVSLLPMQTGLVGVRGRYSQPLYVLMWAVSIVLVIACANVAGLLLARATSRQKEIAIRLALGAGRARIIRQLLTESVLLSLLGGALGIAMATWLSHAIVSFVTGSSLRPVGITAQLDLRVLAFSAAISLLTGILFGLTPALRGIRVNLTPALKEGAGNLSHAAHPGAKWFSIGNGLVVVQVALTIVVLAGAGLLVRTLQNLRTLDPGFDRSNTLLFTLNPTVSGYKGVRVDTLYRDLTTRLAALPGVTSVSFSEIPLLSGSLSSTSTTLVRPGTSEKTTIDIDWFPVGANFFQTVRIPFVAGRDFSPQDFTDAAVRGAARRAANSPSTPAAPSAPRAVIVNEAFVRKYLGAANPLGFMFGQETAPDENGKQTSDPGMQIIGVVRDAKYNSLRREINPITYSASSGNGGSFELRTAANPETLAPTVRSVVNQTDPNLPIFDLITQTRQIDQLLFQERFIARLSSFFGVLALILACVGLYGLLSYEVTQRSREIGIRMALGAQQRNVLGIFVGRGIALTLAGAIVGTGVAIGVMKFIGSFLYDVKPRDPLTQIAVTSLLLIIALAACYIPARRASHVDPLKALRYE